MSQELKIGAIVGAVGLVIGGLFGGLVFPKTIVETENVTITEIVEQTIEVPVDNGNLDLVLNHIYDNDGKVKTLTEDLDDDEIESIVDRIVFLNEVKDKAVAEVKAEAADELHKESFDEVTFDEDDLERIKVQDDDNEVIVSDVDFDDLDADVKVTVKFEQDDVKYEADFNVEIKDNEVDDLTLLEVRYR